MFKGNEIKNLATYEKYHGKGYGTHVLKYIIEEYKNKCKRLSYYKKFGFVYSHTIKNFFVDNYDREMFEDGKQLVDMMNSIRRGWYFT